MIPEEEALPHPHTPSAELQRVISYALYRYIVHVLILAPQGARWCGRGYPLVSRWGPGSPLGGVWRPTSDQSKNKPTNMDNTSMNPAAKEENMWLLQDVTLGHVVKRPIG
jgi:hypothetical protein